MRPSIGLSLLKAGLDRRGISSSIRYFSIRFAELLGWTAYSEIADGTGASLNDLAGEWIFNGALFDVATADEKRYVDEILRGRCTGARNGISRRALERILRARARVDRFLEWCLNELCGERPRVVGFTSSFQQHVASLALARRISQLMPNVAIIFGGANCEGAMGAETVRQFPFVDAAVSGEGDVVVPELVERLLDRRPLWGLPGVRTRREIQADPAPDSWSSAPIVEDLDSLPFPDYSDFFKQFAISRFSRTWEPTILFESSRGCWWGQKRQCTFCGLNGATMQFRSKSPQRALLEIVRLARAHPDSQVQAVDSILDMKYFEVFIPRLAKKHLKSAVFYETKSNLRKEQVRKLRDAGITGIQPGIESLSDQVLGLMHKGVTALQNIQLLKWCKELGVRPYWNLLWGIPGEEADEYERMAALVPLLAHLPPPLAAARVRLDRFSPNFEHSRTLGLTDIQPLDSYSHVYRLPDTAVENLAANFSYRYLDGRSPSAYTRRLSRRVEWWQSIRHADLFSVDLGDPLLIFDLRPGSRQFLTALSRVDRMIYLAADSVTDVRTLSAACGEPPTEIERRLTRITARRLMVRDGQRCLALAIPVGAYQPDPAAQLRFRRAVRRLGTAVRGGTRIELHQHLGVPNLPRAVPAHNIRTIGASLFVIPNDRTLIVRNLQCPERKRR